MYFSLYCVYTTISVLYPPLVKFYHFQLYLCGSISLFLSMCVCVCDVYTTLLPARCTAINLSTNPIVAGQHTATLAI